MPRLQSGAFECERVDPFLQNRASRGRFTCISVAGTCKCKHIWKNDHVPATRVSPVILKRPQPEENSCNQTRYGRVVLLRLNVRAPEPLSLRQSFKLDFHCIAFKHKNDDRFEKGQGRTKFPLTGSEPRWACAVMKVYSTTLRSQNLSCVLASLQQWPLTLQKWFLFNHTTVFSTKGLEESLHDFTRTIFVPVQCGNPIFRNNST